VDQIVAVTLNATLTIGINAGGDEPINSLLGAYLAAIKEGDTKVVLYLDTEHFHLINANVSMFPMAPDNLVFSETESGQSFRLALSDLSSGKINALITSTNSQILMTETLKAKLWSRHTGYPGLLIPVPTKNKSGRSFLMDGGATNRVQDPQIFLSWAKLGSNFLKQYGISEPKIGLANIASERGFPELAKIHDCLGQVKGYQGYAEPANFWNGDIDLWLAEGFVGNLLLKNIEATALFQFHSLMIGLGENESVQAEVKAAAQKMLRYEDHLLSPFLMTSRKWIFRLHGNTKAEEIAKAFEFAARRYAIQSQTW